MQNFPCKICWFSNAYPYARKIYLMFDMETLTANEYLVMYDAINSKRQGGLYVWYFGFILLHIWVIDLCKFTFQVTITLKKCCAKTYFIDIGKYILQFKFKNSKYKTKPKCAYFIETLPWVHYVLCLTINYFFL